MPSTTSIALSGMNAAQTQLRASAHNVANLGTADFHRLEVRQSARQGGGVDADGTRAAVAQPALEQDLVDQLSARNAFLANLAVFKTDNALAGELLDVFA